MLQHKQEEREMKRLEGDVIKKQHQLRRTMEDINNSKSSVEWSFHCQGYFKNTKSCWSDMQCRPNH